MMENLNKLYVSKTLKYYNRKYHRNYTLDDLADLCNTSRQTLVRLSGGSNFDLVKRVIYGIYDFFDVEFMDDCVMFDEAFMAIMNCLIYGSDE